MPEVTTTFKVEEVGRYSGDGWGIEHLGGC